MYAPSNFVNNRADFLVSSLNPLKEIDFTDCIRISSANEDFNLYKTEAELFKIFFKYLHSIFIKLDKMTHYKDIEMELQTITNSIKFLGIWLNSILEYDSYGWKLTANKSGNPCSLESEILNGIRQLRQFLSRYNISLNSDPMISQNDISFIGPPCVSPLSLFILTTISPSTIFSAADVIDQISNLFCKQSANTLSLTELDTAESLKTKYIAIAGSHFNDHKFLQELNRYTYPLCCAVLASVTERQICILSISIRALLRCFGHSNFPHPVFRNNEIYEKMNGLINQAIK
jgi:hypothetical protein